MYLLAGRSNDPVHALHKLIESVIRLMVRGLVHAWCRSCTHPTACAYACERPGTRFIATSPRVCLAGCIRIIVDSHIHLFIHGHAHTVSRGT